MVPSSARRVHLALLAALLVVLMSAVPSYAKCDPTTDPDKSDIANARAAVAANCDCAGATSHGDYVKCAVQQANKVLVNPSCKGAVKKCAAHSTCGKPTAVTCCLTTTKGTKCKVKKDVAHCTAKQGTVGSCTSCCDACPAPGSGLSCPTATTTTTTTLVGNTTTTMGSGGTTTTTTTSTTPTSTTCPPPAAPTVVKGSLTATVGRFNYNATLGLPGANAACNTNFPGTHACTLTELQSAPASDLTCLQDTASMAVTSFWAIDPMAAGLSQCIDDVGSNLNWEYGTAHTASRGQRVTLNNATGALGSLETGLQCNISGSNWVGCCQ